MKLDEFTFSLAILAFPGIITFMILKRVAPQSKESGFEAFLKIFVYSVSAYLLYSISLSIYSCFSSNESNEDPTLGFLDRESIGTKEIYGATISAIFLAVLLSYAQTYNWLNKFARLISASTRSGDKDLWTYYHNLSDKDKNQGWVLVRDHAKHVIYYGAIIGWSENSEGNKELIITDAQVFKEEENGRTELLYESKVIYLNQNPEHISIEVPNPETTNEQEQPKSTTENQHTDTNQ